MEEYFGEEMIEYEKKIKWSYYLRAIILIVIVFLQVGVFLRLIDKKLDEIKEIVAGPR